MDPFLTSGDLFLLPSSQESFGLAALEAMAYGIPVVGSAIGGLPELIAHGKNGFLAPVGDIEAMASYAIKLLKNPGLYEPISQQARETARKQFHPQNIIPHYEQYYSALLQKT